jgi:hypothetical protein
VTNVINLSVPWVLQPAAAGGGLTLRVEASYEVQPLSPPASSYTEVVGKRRPDPPTQVSGQRRRGAQRPRRV